MSNPLDKVTNESLRQLYLSTDPFFGFTVDDEKNLLKTILFSRVPLLTITLLFCINLSAILITFYQYSMFQLLAYILLTQLITCFVYVHLTRFYYIFHGYDLSIEEITRFDGQDFDPESIRISVEYATHYICLSLSYLITVYRCGNTAATCAVIMFLFILAQIAYHIPSAILCSLSLTFLCIGCTLSRSPTYLNLYYKFALHLMDGKSRAPQPQQSLHNAADNVSIPAIVTIDHPNIKKYTVPSPKTTFEPSHAMR